MPAKIAALTEGIVKAMLLTKGKKISVLMAAFVLAVGVAAWRSAIQTPSAPRATERLAELKKQADKPNAAKEKPPGRVGQIFILGNTKTKQDVILEQVPLFPGQILSYPDLRAAERNLSRLKIFKNVQITLLGNDSEYKDIKITVEEK